MKKVRFDELKPNTPYLIKMLFENPVIVFCKEVKDIRWREKELITDGYVYTAPYAMQQSYISVHRGDTIIALDKSEYNDFIEANKRYKAFFNELVDEATL